MTQPRLFADYAHQPTRRERINARHDNERHQLELLAEPDAPKPDACPVCAGDHAEPCHHGTAPALPARWPMGHLIVIGTRPNGTTWTGRCDCGGMSAHLESHRHGPHTDSLTFGRILAGRNPHTGTPTHTQETTS